MRDEGVNLKPLERVLRSILVESAIHDVAGVLLAGGRAGAACWAGRGEANRRQVYAGECRGNGRCGGGGLGEMPWMRILRTDFKDFLGGVREEILAEVLSDDRSRFRSIYLQVLRWKDGKFEGRRKTVMPPQRFEIGEGIMTEISLSGGRVAANGWYRARRLDRIRLCTRPTSLLEFHFLCIRFCRTRGN